MPAADPEELRRLIRQSPALDPTLRRHWLQVLPHLMPADQDRLRAILAAPAAREPS